MTDETALAFDTVLARSMATADAAPLDRIAVRDFTTSVEIGAFQVERDVEQRIRFNVVLEVARHHGADTDDVDQVLSYDTITEAIRLELAAERLNLLETLAERIAERILTHAKAMRVFVRIEKLDRIPGTLGVEIMRSKPDGSPVQTEPPTGAGLRPLVVFLPNKILSSTTLKGWLDRIAGHERPAIICLEAIENGVPSTDQPKVDRRLGLLSIEQNAWLLSSLDPRCVVVASRTELDWAMKNRQLSVWAPSKMVLDAVDDSLGKPDAPLMLAGWIAQQFSAAHLTIAGGYETAGFDAPFVVVQGPDGL